MTTKLENRKKLAKNTIFSGLTSLSDIFLLLLLIFAGRILGPEEYGFFSFSLAITSILVFFLNLGIDSLAIREIAINRDKAKLIISSTFSWKLLISSLILIIFLSLSYYITNEKTLTSLLLILAPAAVLRSINMTLRSYIQAFEHFRIESIIVFLERFLLFTVGIFALWNISTPEVLAWSFFLVRSFSALIYIFIINKYICQFYFKIDFIFIKRFQIEAIPLGVATLIFGIYTQIDTILLGLFRPAIDVGLFSAPQKIYEGCFVFALIINSATYPRLANLFQFNPERHRDLFFRSFKYLFMLAILLTLTGALFSHEIILLFFGNDYLAAKHTLTILLAAISLYFFIASIFTLFRSMGMQKTVMLISLLGLSTKVVSNLALIPDYGYQGAAFSVIISTVMMLAAGIYMLNKRSISLHNISLTLIRITASGLLASLPVIFLTNLPFIFNASIFLAMYISLLLVLHCFDKYELELIKNILPFFRNNKA